MSSLNIDRKRIYLRSILLKALQFSIRKSIYTHDTEDIKFSGREVLLMERVVEILEMYSPQEIEDIFKEKLYG